MMRTPPIEAAQRAWRWRSASVADGAKSCRPPTSYRGCVPRSTGGSRTARPGRSLLLDSFTGPRAALPGWADESRCEHRDEFRRPHEYRADSTEGTTSRRSTRRSSIGAATDSTTSASRSRTSRGSAAQYEGRNYQVVFSGAPVPSGGSRATTWTMALSEPGFVELIPATPGTGMRCSRVTGRRSSSGTERIRSGRSAEPTARQRLRSVPRQRPLSLPTRESDMSRGAAQRSAQPNGLIGSLPSQSTLARQ